MEATHKPLFDFENSRARIDEILNAGDDSFSDSSAIPSREKLTFTNGFYVYCSALFVDIRHSSDMTDKHRRPVLAKIYRSFISEMVALMNDYSKCKEVSINGDCVWCVCDTPYKSDVDDIFSLAARVCSLVDVINFKLEKKGYLTFKVGVGIDYGRALMIKVGHKGADINDVVWMGDVVNEACHLSNEAGGSHERRIFLSNVIYENLSDNLKKLCHKDSGRDIYQANVVNVEMNQWLEAQNS